MTDIPEKQVNRNNPAEREHATLHRPKAGRHRAAAFAACFVSVALHGALVYLLFTLPFSPLAQRAELLNSRIFRDVEIKQDEAVPEPEPETTPRSEGIGAVRAEVDAEELAVSEESLTPEQAEATMRTEGSLAGPGKLPDPSEWKPRQDILAIEEKIVDDQVSALPRRLIPAVERIRDSEEIIPPVDRDHTAPDETEKEDLAPGDGPSPGVKAATAPVDFGSGDLDGGTAAEMAGDEFGEQPEDVSELKAIEDVLDAEVTVFEGRRKSEYLYFRIDIQRAGKKELPVIPKDVVLVQDCSASLTDRRLHFCKEGLKRSLPLIRKGDRFNVIAFREKVDKCFNGWAEKTPENLRKAGNFIEALRSGGNTDLYSSLIALSEIERKPGRPAVAIVVTDGLPTSGITDSTEIIGRFSKINDGTMSIFAMGAVGRANTYLLDIVSYSNKGDVYVINRGRWEIPDAVKNLMEQVSRPVMADLSFRFAEGITTEVYPVLSSDLYLDRPLTLYGRCPKSNDRIVFQAVGQGGDVECDMIFDIDLSSAGRSSEEDVRESWANQKIYHLLGEYARKRNSQTLRELRATAEDYNLRVPYHRSLR